jgi:excisionase family DNA binding protein
MSTTKPITVEEAARILGVVPDHVRLLIRRGRIEATRFSTVWLVDAGSVKEYLTAGRTPTKGRPRKTKATKKKGAQR